MIKAKDKDIYKILEYLKGDVENCLYMYIDISYYSLEVIDVWYEMTGDSFSVVAMKYHDSFQIYSHDPCRVELSRLIKLLKKHDPAMINGSKAIIDRLRPSFEERISDGGSILRLKKFITIDNNEFEVVTAQKSDIPEISMLISEEPYYSDSYSYEEIYEQLLERIETGMGVSFIIRKEGYIIAHNAITAQVEDICISSMLVVHKEWRKSDAALVIEKYIIDFAKENGKKLFGFSTDKRRQKQFELMGNEVVAAYGKLVLNHNQN